MTATPPPPSTNRITRRELLAGAGAIAGGAILGAALPTSAFAASVPNGASRYVPLEPFRVLDTRKGIGRPNRRIGPTRVRTAIGGYTDPETRQRVAPNATAIVVNVAAINGPELSHVQVFPSHLATPPQVAVMNLRAPGQVLSNMVTTQLSSRGEFDINTLRSANLVVDVVGYYEPVTESASAGRFRSITSSRAYDSRRGLPMPGDRGSVLVDVTNWTASDASAVVINLAAVLSNAPGHVSAVPAWRTATPTTATLNLKYAGDSVSASAIVPIRTVNGRRQIKIYAHSSCHVIVDVNGYFTGETSLQAVDGLFVPVTPQRILDTRGLWPTKLGAKLGRLWDGWIVEAAVTRHAEVSSSTMGQIGAVAVNVTAFESRGFPRAGGHFTLSAAGLPVPHAASVNWSQAGSYSANHAITEVTYDGVQIHTVTGAGAIIDMSGYFVGRPKTRRLPVLTPDQQVPPPIPPTWYLQVPNLWDSSTGQYGRWHTVIDHQNGDTAVDEGYLWHWTNTGNMIESRDVFVLGHRTSVGGPFRNLHSLPVGSAMYVDTTDGRRYSFVYRGMTLTGKDPESILRAADAYSGRTLSLVACTAGYAVPGKAWYEPTSIEYRLVATFEFVDWEVTSG